MSDIDYEKANLYDLAYVLEPTDSEKCSEIDPYLAEKIETLESLFDIYYYLCYGDMYKMLPETKKRVNVLLTNYLHENSEDISKIEWWRFKNFPQWIDEKLSEELTKAWLDSEDNNADSAWLADSIPPNSDLSIKALEKLVGIYKKNRSNDHIKVIEKIFVNTNTDYIGKACEVVAKSTPAIAACLLSRGDIPDSYTLKGLKALSKLSKQRKIDVKIDFDMLGHLGSKSRLDAMKQLMGMLDKYYVNRNRYNNTYNNYNYNRNNRQKVDEKITHPFKKLPTRDEIEKFLFPCSLKYNEQVVELMKRYEVLTNHKGGM